MKQSELDHMLKMMAVEEKESRNGPPERLKNLIERKLGKNVPPYTIEDGILTFETGGQTQLITDEMVMNDEESISLSKHSCYLNAVTHSHTFIEMNYVYSGKCTQIINHKEVTLEAGDICILDTNVAHSIQSVGEEDIIINLLMRTNYFDTALLSRLAGNDLMSNFLIHATYQSKEYNNFILFHSGSNEKIRQWMQDLMCEYYDRSLCSDEVINCYVVLIFSELLRIYQSQTVEEQFPITNKINISDILNFLGSHYKNATLAATAEYFGYHPNYLSQLLTKKTGKNFKSHLQEQKLRKACLLLNNTDLSIEAICKEIGYENKSFFYKKFRELFQVTPQEFRKLKQVNRPSYKKG